MTSPIELRFSHIGFHVRDLDAMADFYARVLGFTVTDRGQLGDTKLVFLSRDPTEHHQVVLASGRPLEPGFNPINQISFRCGSLADLRTLRRAIAGEPVSDIHPVTHGNAWSLYFRDPEGNRIEVFVDSPWYVEQPVREPLDLEQSDAAILAATEAFCRGRPGFKPRAAWLEQMRAKMAMDAVG